MSKNYLSKQTLTLTDRQYASGVILVTRQMHEIVGVTVLSIA